VFAVLLSLFVFSQWRRGKRAILPLHMLKRRAQVGAALEAFFLFMGILVGTYYLPLWYQGTKGHSATRSGLDILPFMMSVVVFAGCSGAVISVGLSLLFIPLSKPCTENSSVLAVAVVVAPTVRHWRWFVVHGGCAYLQRESDRCENSENAFIPYLTSFTGYQILFGCGIGGAMQNTVIAVQSEYAREERLIPQATSIVNFLQLIGGVVGIAYVLSCHHRSRCYKVFFRIAGTIFDNQLRHNIPKNLPPGVAEAVVASVTAIKTLPPDVKTVIIEAYAKSLQPVFILGVPAGIMASLCAL
jgi:hypothetical protein